jgi:septation ring formation regulator EzrA
MTMQDIGERAASNPLWIGVISAVVGVLLGFLSQSYFKQDDRAHEHDQAIDNRISEQDNRLHAQDISIDALKITTTAIGVEVKGTESSIAEVLASQNANAATLQVLKDSDDARKEQMNEIKQQLSAINDVLRPTRTFPHN